MTMDNNTKEVIEMSLTVIGFCFFAWCLFR